MSIKGETNEKRVRITILVSKQTKAKWKKFIKKYNLSNISWFLRKAAEYYQKFLPKIPSMESISELTHDLKEPLNVIKSYSQLLINNYSDKLQLDILLKIKEIFSQSYQLETIINDLEKNFEVNGAFKEYDVLIIDDDFYTNLILQEYFKNKGYNVKGIKSGSKGLQELELYKPKLILLDIILPDMDGFELCKTIKSKKEYESIPIYFITALSNGKVKSRIEDTGADGYFLKPFDFNKFGELLNYL